MANEATKVVTSKAQASYANVLAPQVDQKGKAKYSIALVFFPSAETTAFEKQALAAAIAAGRKKFGDKFDAMVKGGSVLLKGGKGAVLRTDVDEKILSVICDGLGDVATQMDELARIENNATNTQNLDIVRTNHAAYEQEWLAIKRAKGVNV
jgi:hypothetical protein